MAIYAFRCSRCGVVLEELMPMATATFEDRPCPVETCTGKCVYQLKGAPAVATDGMSKQSFDVTIGKDAAKRWERYHERQKVRNSVRTEAGGRANTPLKAKGINEYEPLKGGRFAPVGIPEAVEQKFTAEALQKSLKEP